MTTTQLTDEQLKTIILQARQGDKYAQFYCQRLEKMDFMREQFLRVKEECN